MSVPFEKNPKTIESPKKREVGDIFRTFGPAYRQEHSLPLEHLKVMRAIEKSRLCS